MVFILLPAPRGYTQTGQRANHAEKDYKTLPQNASQQEALASDPNLYPLTKDGLNSATTHKSVSTLESLGRKDSGKTKRAYECLVPAFL